VSGDWWAASGKERAVSDEEWPVGSFCPAIATSLVFPGQVGVLFLLGRCIGNAVILTEPAIQIGQAATGAAERQCRALLRIEEPFTFWTVAKAHRQRNTGADKLPSVLSTISRLPAADNHPLSACRVRTGRVQGSTSSRSFLSFRCRPRSTSPWGLTNWAACRRRRPSCTIRCGSPSCRSRNL